MDAPAARAALVWCPFPDAASARAAADTLLGEGVVACANILPGIEAHFVWQGERGSAQEVAVLFKTLEDRLDRAVERLGAIHPYDTPAIAGWVCDAAHPASLAWLAASLPPDPRRAQ